jgi:YgiT-type zinc finger domain-containing protein
MTDVSVTLWLGTELKVVEGVPARICERCQARSYDDATERKLASLVASGAPDWKANRVIAVPVFAYSEIADFAATPQTSGDTAPLVQET